MSTAMRVTFTEARTASEIAAQRWGCPLSAIVVTMGNDEHATLRGPGGVVAEITAGVELVPVTDDDAAVERLDAMLCDAEEPAATVHRIGPSCVERLAAELMLLDPADYYEVCERAGMGLMVRSDIDAKLARDLLGFASTAAMLAEGIAR
jgi:hypothetical protein